MSELVNNLQSIYNIKLQIKDVLGTDSDLFEDYPDLIEEAMSAGAGGSATPVDPLNDATVPQAMIEDEIENADYVGSMISDNWSYEYSEDGGEVSYTVSWDEITTIDVDGDSVEKIVRVEIDGDPSDIVMDGANINAILESDESFYNSISPTLTNATLTASEDPSEDGYDYLLVGDLYAWNLSDNCGEAEEITENGFVLNTGQIGFNVNVPSGGMSEGIFNIFNFLSYGLYYNMVEISNKGFEEINLYNLGPVNYFDPMDGTDTKNQYVEMTLWDNPQMDTEVEFVNVQGDATSDGSDHWHQFNELSQSSDADEFMAVHIDVYDWASDIDPETGMDAGSWEVSDTYVAAFENVWNEPGDGAWTYTIRFYYDNNNSEWLVDLYQNGILVEEGVSAFAQQ